MSGAATLLAGSLLVGANAADVATTRAAVGRGGVEVNALYGPGTGRLVPIKAAVTAAETAGFAAIHRHHKRTAWLYVAAVVGVNLVVARHNSRVMR